MFILKGRIFMPNGKSGLLFLACAAILFADGFVIFPLPNPTPLYVRYHKVACSIDNGVATTVIDQEFVNPLEDALANGTYVFPIPKNAAITGFSVVVDGAARQATTMSAAEARKFFSEAMRNSQQASLLEYTQNGALSLDIGNIASNASRRIKISYVEILPKIDGLSKYLYPLNTEKYSMRLIDTVSVAVSISNSTPITTVFSPSFPIIVERSDPNKVTAVYRAAKSRPDRDFELYYKLSDEALSFHLFPFKQGTDDGYFLMLITPQFKKDTVQKAVAKDMVFTIDRSGSMSGVKVQQAKDGLTYCVNRLLPEDFFTIVMFNHTVSASSDELQPAAATNIPPALDFVRAIAADGNTDIAKALTTSLSKIKESGRPHYVIFLTDGQPTSGVTDNSQISALVNAGNTNSTRIFSVGFGFDVNTTLIDKISMDNGGYPLYCNPDQNIEQVISDLYKRIEAPILTSPVLSIASTGNVITSGISPEKLPDLFSGSEIAVYGRYKGNGSASVSLSGRVGEKRDSMAFSAEFPDSSTQFAFVPRLWATQQIARLMARIKLQTMTGESLTPLIDSVKSLSLAYGIVTPYTSQVFTAPGGISWGGALQVTSGKSANDASNFMQGMQQNSNASQTMVADTNALPVTVAPQVNQIQNAGNKAFVYAPDSIWRDASFDSAKPSDTVAYASDEYFSLAAQSPELLKFLSVGCQTAFNFQGQNYLVLYKGKQSTPIGGKAQSQSGAARPKAFSLACKGTTVVFSGLTGLQTGSVTVYAASGSVVAVIPVRPLEHSAAWDGMKAAGPGVFVAVYREAGLKGIRKFTLIR
jgi:Ca-activated chloride channel homolog